MPSPKMEVTGGLDLDGTEFNQEKCVRCSGLVQFARSTGWLGLLVIKLRISKLSYVRITEITSSAQSAASWKTENIGSSPLL